VNTAASTIKVNHRDIVSPPFRSSQRFVREQFLEVRLDLLNGSVGIIGHGLGLAQADAGALALALPEVDFGEPKPDAAPTRSRASAVTRASTKWPATPRRPIRLGWRATLWRGRRKKMSLLTQIGSISALASAIFLVWDRFMAGQPLVWPARKPEFRAESIRFLRCMNVSKWDILIKKIKVIPNVLSVARDDSAEGITDAHYLNLPFQTLIPAGETIDFPLGIRRGDDDSSPFLIIVSWRSARSTGLPKVPVFVSHPCGRYARSTKQSCRDRGAWRNEWRIQSDKLGRCLTLLMQEVPI
jgi:hypothetical protein